jgi:hypothetical protein
MLFTPDWRALTCTVRSTWAPNSEKFYAPPYRTPHAKIVVTDRHPVLYPITHHCVKLTQLHSTGENSLHPLKL